MYTYSSGIPVFVFATISVYLCMIQNYYMVKSNTERKGKDMDGGSGWNGGRWKGEREVVKMGEQAKECSIAKFKLSHIRGAYTRVPVQGMHALCTQLNLVYSKMKWLPNWNVYGTMQIFLNYYITAF